MYASINFFYKKLGSGHSTKSFVISHEILSILVLKVISVVANTAADMFLDILNIIKE